MHPLIISAFLSCALATPHSYGPPPPPPPPPPPRHHSHHRYGGSGGYGVKCYPGYVVNVDGRCAAPIITRSFFAYSPPPPEPVAFARPILPPPRVDYNVVFVKTPERLREPDPIVVPPPQQKTVVYVLNKNGQIQGQRIIELPAQPQQSPEVFYVNYDEGEDKLLPGGVQLQDALQSVHAHEGRALYGGAVEKGYGRGEGGYGGETVYGGGIRDAYSSRSSNYIEPPSTSFTPPPENSY